MTFRRLLIAGGGTGGHVFPALALGEAFLASDPSAALLFVGARGGLEGRLVNERGHRLVELGVGKLRGEGLRRRLGTLAGLPAAVFEAIKVLREFRPEVVVGVGGYASGPVAAAATLLRIPVVLLEQNAILGATNRAIAHFAEKVVVAFPSAAKQLPAAKVALLGNPLRSELQRALEHAPPDARRATPERTLLVMGGSQGATYLNELLWEAAPALTRRFPLLRIVHQTGMRDYERVRERYREMGLRAEVQPFIADMADCYRRIDLALCRSGAMTIAELCAFGVPALLVPYPHAAGDHQAANAADLVVAGGALLRRQQELDAERLVALLGSLFGDPQRLESMAQAMRALGRPQAASDVLSLLREVTSRRGG